MASEGPLPRTSYQFIRNECKPGLRWRRRAMICGAVERPISVLCIAAPRISLDSIERCCVVYDLRGDGNTGNKIATMEMTDATERRRCDYAGSLR